MQQRSAAATEVSSVSLGKSDFSPASGRGTPPANTSGDEADVSGPWNLQLRVARSSNGGRTFTDSGEVVTDQGGVPNLLVDDSGVLRVYYNAWQNGENFPAVAMRKATATGGWVYKKLSLEGAPKFADPHVLQLDDGSYRMYYGRKINGSSTESFYSATSTDGIHFTPDTGCRFDPGKACEAPMVLETDDGYLLMAGPLGQYALTSSDGLTFKQDTKRTVGQSFMPFAGVELPSGGYRIFGAMGKGNARTAYSKDGKSWTLESGSFWPTGDGFNGNGENGVAVVGDELVMVYTALIGGESSSSSTQTQPAQRGDAKQPAGGQQQGQQAGQRQPDGQRQPTGQQPDGQRDGQPRPPHKGTKQPPMRRE